MQYKRKKCPRRQILFPLNGIQFFIFSDFIIMLWLEVKTKRLYIVKAFSTDTWIPVARIKKVQKTDCIFFISMQLCRLPRLNPREKVNVRRWEGSARPQRWQLEIEKNRRRGQGLPPSPFALTFDKRFSNTDNNVKIDHKFRTDHRFSI